MTRDNLVDAIQYGSIAGGERYFVFTCIGKDSEDGNGFASVGNTKEELVDYIDKSFNFTDGTYDCGRWKGNIEDLSIRFLKTN